MKHFDHRTAVRRKALRQGPHDVQSHRSKGHNGAWRRWWASPHPHALMSALMKRGRVNALGSPLTREDLHNVLGMKI